MLLGTVDMCFRHSREERQRDKGMALAFIPPDLIEQAAREENWTDSDRQHCSRMLRQAFEESLQGERDSAKRQRRARRLQRSVSVRPASSALGAKRQLLSHFQQNATAAVGITLIV